MVVIMREKDANTLWDAASDATLEERRYYCQNWRADVDALLKGDGAVSEWVRYSAYGEATVYPMVGITARPAPDAVGLLPPDGLPDTGSNRVAASRSSRAGCGHVV